MADAPSESLGIRLKREREKHHWTQEELAQKSDVSVSSIRRWENNRAMPRPDERTRLAKALGKPPDEWGIASPRWNVPFPRIRYFTGRDKVLSHLHQKLAAEQVTTFSKALALIGLAGIGKTQTAVEYAYRYYHEYEAVLWARSDSETLLSSFAELSAVLELPERLERDQNQVVSSVRHWLEKHDSWLLIFDNADNPALIFDLLPGRLRGAVLLTTRSQATGPHIQKIKLGRLSRDAATRFLLNRINTAQDLLPERQNPQAQELAGALWEDMDGLPLALDQAAAYMEETDCTLGDYLGLFKTNRKQLLARRGETASEHRELVAATWLMALKEIERIRPVAADLLRFFAFFHPDAIPEPMITEGARSLGPVLQAIAADKSAWNEAIATLLKYSLVKRESTKETLSVHRLVQAVIKDSMNQKAVQKWVERTVQVINAAFPDPEPASWQQCEALLPHALLAARYIEESRLFSEEAGRLTYKAAVYLQERARYNEAEALYLQALRLREQQKGMEHPDIAASLNGLGSLYRDTSKYAAAELCYLRALSIQEHWLGKEHLDVANSLAGLANLYRDQSKYAEAEPLHLHALAIREQQLGPKHVLVAASLHLLASLYTDISRYPEAEPLLLRALAIREQTHGQNHPDVAYSLNSLAVIYLQQDKYAEAEPVLRRALTIRKQIYGQNHPETASSLNNLATLYHWQGKHAEAAPLFQEALHIMEQLLGTTNSRVARLYSNVAEIYAALKQYDEAEQLYQQSLHTWKQLSEPEHADVIFPLDGLATLYLEQRKYEEAEPLYREAIRISEKIQGLEYPETVRTIYHLALLRNAQNNQEEAKALCLQALTIQEKVLGQHHSSTIETRSLLIVVLRTLGLHEEAARLEAVQAEPKGSGQSS